MNNLKPLIRQFLSYCVVGGINTLTCIAVMGLGNLMGLHYVFYTAIGYAAAMVVSFWLNLSYTFKAQGGRTAFFIRFIAFNLLNLAFAQILQILLIEVIGLHEYIGIAIAMVAYTLTGFVLNRQFVFKSKKAS